MSKTPGIDVFIGRAVLSVETANKLGQVHDLIVHPTKGELVGLSVEIPDQSHFLVTNDQIRRIGPDAVMVESNRSLVSPDQSPLGALPLAKNNLIGVKVITEDGKLLGEIANIYVHLEETSCLLIYEVRSSILDKLLGHALYFPASFGFAIADDLSRLVVSNDTEKAAHKLDVVLGLFAPPASFAPQVVVRTHSD